MQIPLLLGVCPAAETCPLQASTLKGLWPIGPCNSVRKLGATVFFYVNFSNIHFIVIFFKHTKQKDTTNTPRVSVC